MPARGIVTVIVSLVAVFAWMGAGGGGGTSTRVALSDVASRADAGMGLSAEIAAAESDTRSTHAVDPALVSQQLPSADAAADHDGPHTCPDGMLLVEGEYCPNVDQECLRWADPPDVPFPMRCAEFAPSQCLGRRRHLSFCMDTYEYPNRAGAYPQVMVSWYAARRTCEARGARLCNMAEWTFACEGEQMLPYPYGLRRDSNICHIDHERRRPDPARLHDPATEADESARVYDAVPSGQYDRCVSPFGIHDMTGNVDEWVTNETGHPFQSALKGGWWGPIRARCRATTVSHNEGFYYYQIGFRCCADPT